MWSLIENELLPESSWSSKATKIKSPVYNLVCANERQIKLYIQISLLDFLFGNFSSDPM